MDKPYKQIIISLHERAEDAIIQVTDNGAGIDPVALPYILIDFTVRSLHVIRKQEAVA